MDKIKTISNSNSKVTLRLSPKQKRSSANEPLDVKSQSPTGFILYKHIEFILSKDLIKLDSYYRNTHKFLKEFIFDKKKGFQSILKDITVNRNSTIVTLK